MKILFDFLPIVLFFGMFKYAEGNKDWAAATATEWLGFTPHSGHEPVRDLFFDRESFNAWALQYSERVTHVIKGLRVDLMLKNNPKFVLRNHLGEEAIRAAKLKDFSKVNTLLNLLQSPFDEHPGHDSEAGFPPDWAASIEISCSS